MEFFDRLPRVLDAIHFGLANFRAKTLTYDPALLMSAAVTAELTISAGVHGD